MTTSNDHASLALDHVVAVRATRGTLNDLYRHAPDRQRDIGRLANELRDALKLADIHAALATAEQLERIADLLEDRL